MKTITIDGVIGTGKGEVSAAMVREQLPKDGSEIAIKIHSEGGSAFEGFAIHDLLKAYPGKKTCTVESCAFSIASYVPMACEEIEITPNGYMMLHNPYMSFEGDDEAFAKQSDLLKNVKGNMVAAYAERSGKSVEEIEKLLKSETYLTAAQAVESGFANRITATPVKKDRVLARVNEMPHGVVAALFEPATSGIKIDSKKGKPMSESGPVAATTKQIKAAFPKAKSEFIIKCLEAEMTMEDVGKEHASDTEKENETLSAKVAAMEKELGELKALKACSDEEEKPEAKVAAKASGVKPIAKAKTVSSSARDQWNEVVESNVKAGMDRMRACRKANLTHGELRAAMVAEVNS